MIYIRDNYFQFDLVFIKKKITKPKIKNKTEISSNRPISVQFSLVF